MKTKKLDLESHFNTVTQVEVEETVIDLPLDLWNYGPSSEIDIENPDNLQQVLITYTIPCAK